MSDDLAPDAPCEQQTIRVSADRIDALREWAEEGTALTAAVRVRDPEGRTAFVKTAWSDGWILPGGAVEPGEDPPTAAAREVREETGLDPAVGDPLVVFEQSYVDAERGDGGRIDSERGDTGGPVAFEASYVVYEASAAGDIPDSDRLGVDPDEIRDARWFDGTPARLQDGDLLRRYL